MNKRNKISKQSGLTLTELMVVSSLSIFILMMVYQVSKGAMNLFQTTKSNSDALENKTPSMEIINRYFERWGVSTIFSTPYYINAAIDATDNNIYKITFYTNMGGFGFVRNASATSIDLMSCRLNDSIDPLVIKDSSGDTCFYVYKGNDGSLKPTITTNPANENSTYNSLKFTFLKSLSLPTAGECVTPSFFTDVGSNNTNLTVNYTGVLGLSRDGVVASNVTLESGDFIFPTPQKVQLYVAPNSNDSNRKWLYSKVTSLASHCNQNPPPAEALAPADSITLDSPTTLPSTSSKTATITIKFRSDFKGKGSKFFTVTRIFGG